MVKMAPKDPKESMELLDPLDLTDPRDRVVTLVKTDTMEKRVKQGSMERKENKGLWDLRAGMEIQGNKERRGKMEIWALWDPLVRRG